MKKILIFEKDFKIIQKRVIHEYFIWTCPNCNTNHETSEYNVKDQKLFCVKCLNYTPYSFK